MKAIDLLRLKKGEPISPEGSQRRKSEPYILVRIEDDELEKESVYRASFFRHYPSARAGLISKKEFTA